MPIEIEQLVIDGKLIKERLVQELAKHGKSKTEWVQITGIGIETIRNILNPERDMGVVNATYLHAFWLFDQSLDLHYIITGERTAPKVFIRTEGPVEVIKE